MRPPHVTPFCFAKIGFLSEPYVGSLIGLSSPRCASAPLKQILLKENTMKTTLAAVAFATMSISPVLAQSSPSPQEKSTSAEVNSRKTAAHKIKHQLERAGFSDIKFLAKTFVVQAKSQDGDEVLMTFGPHGQAVSEAIHSTGSSSDNSPSTSSQNGSR